MRRYQKYCVEALNLQMNSLGYIDFPIGIGRRQATLA